MGIVLKLSIHVDLFFDDADMVPGDADDPFDEILAFVFRILEDDNVTPVGMARSEKISVTKGILDPIRKL